MSEGEAPPTSAAAPTVGTSPSPVTTRDVQPPEGWKEFSAPGFRVWLPPFYEGGELTSEGLQSLIQIYRDRGLEDFVTTMEQIKQQANLFALHG